MKRYHRLLRPLLCAFCFLSLLTLYYKPSAAALTRTAAFHGVLHFSSDDKAVVDGVVLMCGMDFLTSDAPCQDRVPALHNGALITADVLNLRLAAGTVTLTMAIHEDGKLLYHRSPMQAIRAYLVRSLFRMLVWFGVLGVLFALLTAKAPARPVVSNDGGGSGAEDDHQCAPPRPGWSIPAWLAFSGAMLMCAYFGELHLVHHYQPTREALEQTTSTTGRMQFVWAGARHSQRIAEVNGIALMCTLDYLGMSTTCPKLVPALTAGTVMTVTMAYLPAAIKNKYVATAIVVNGQEVYARTPEQVIADYITASHDDLLIGPTVVSAVLLFLTIVMIAARVDEARRLRTPC